MIQALYVFHSQYRWALLKLTKDHLLLEYWELSYGHAVVALVFLFQLWVGICWIRLIILPIKTFFY